MKLKLTAAEVREETAKSDALVAQIRPLLAGKAPQLQGIVVAELMAIYIAGHAPELRDDIMKAQLVAIEGLVKLWHEALWEGRDA